MCPWIRFVTERDNAVSPSEHAELTKRVTEGSSLAERKDIAHGVAHLIESAASAVDWRPRKKFVNAAI